MKVVISMSILILSILISACNGNRKQGTVDIEESEYPIVLNIDDAIRKKIAFNLSDFVDSIKYIYIESTICDVAEPIMRLEVTDNHMFFYDGFGRLLCYNLKGQFIRQIASTGKGPGEYLRLKAIALDEEKNIIYALCDRSNSIFKYSIQGKFLGKIPVETSVDALRLVGGNLLLHIANWNGEKENQYIMMDSSGVIITKYPNPYKYKLQGRNTYFNEVSFYKYKNLLHMKDKSDTLYVFKGNQRIPKYIFKSTYSISNKNLTQMEYDRALNFWYIFETDTRIQFAFEIDNKFATMQHAYYDKTTGQLYITEILKLKNNIDDGNYLPLINQNNQFITRLRRGFEMDNPPLEIEDEDPLVLSLLYLK